MTLVLFRYQNYAADCLQSFEAQIKTSAIMVASNMCDESKMILTSLKKRDYSVMVNLEAMLMAWNAYLEFRLEAHHDIPWVHFQCSYTSCSGSTPTPHTHIIVFIQETPFYAFPNNGDPTTG